MEWTNVFSLDIEESIRVWIQFVKLKENRGGDGQMLKLGDRRRRPARHEDKEERWNCQRRKTEEDEEKWGEKWHETKGRAGTRGKACSPPEL